MDGTRFDSLTQRLVRSSPSRRGLLRLGVGGGLAALIFGQVAEEALACRQNGKPCGDGRNGDCCSGTCKNDKCRPNPAAKGCTVQMDVCKGEAHERACPNHAAGTCIVLDNGKPFCFEEGTCFRCRSNAHCTNRAGGVPGKCLKRCGACNQDSNGRACVYGKAPGKVLDI